MVDSIITKCALQKENRSYKLLTKFKKANSWVANCCITRSVLAFLLWGKYSNYLEKKADVHAAQAVGPEGGIEYFGRIEKTAVGRRGDPMHPFPKERARYLREFRDKSN